ncbi:forkhead-associated domain-containing protein 1 [Lampris incognitus]|uniref:forkhead-associated domain-containing protein 1 n=1 Tax=Lampris incognitus TaxID=2546036 RepID=UPI0024B4BDE9|nr:forkhead-associated domain-containing protein 1 [Lampris incognitus]
MFRRMPKAVEQQEGEDLEPPEGGSQLRRRRTIKKKRRVVSFRVKQTLPRVPKLSAQSSDKLPVLEETVEMQDLTPFQESTVEIQPVEMAAYPTEGNPLESEESDGLMEWWNTVEGWTEWNETSNFQEDDEEIAVEQAADRVFMAARLFVRLFNQRGASLQQRILEMLSQADAADQFHKRTVSAAVGGGVASVAGSVATITGLILAPFTFGASIIVTAVGIGVATAGSITSATANITDTVHSNMDRKKVEKMIQGYQEEIKDIRECLEFVQEGMDTLQEWDFEKYSESAAKKALNHNIKHVMKEGGRAGKALMINTDKLISTVQVLGAAGGAAKAAQAISVTTGVMSALFLALDVFFLAKDSHELRKGAKTKFATKIREVCKDLQDGLLELNKVKTQLQKTMDGIELEEYEEIEEVEVEVEDELESDPVKLAQLEEELDLLEEKLDKKFQEEQTGSKSKETKKKGNVENKEGKEKENKKEKLVPEEKEAKGKKGRENGEKEARENEEKREEEDKDGKNGGKEESKENIGEGRQTGEEKQEEEKIRSGIDEEEVLKETSVKGRKERETENCFTTEREKNKIKQETTIEITCKNEKTEEERKERDEKSQKAEEQNCLKSMPGSSDTAAWSGAVDSQRVKSKREEKRKSNLSNRLPKASLESMTSLRVHAQATQLHIRVENDPDPTALKQMMTPTQQR